MAKKPKHKKRISVAAGKSKGRKLQQWACKKIADLLNCEWGPDEQIASREGGQSGTDVRLTGDAKDSFPWSVECKYCETWAVPRWIAQAKDNRKPGTDWLLIMRKNRHEEIVALDAEVFFDLLKMIPFKKKGR